MEALFNLLLFTIALACFIAYALIPSGNNNAKRSEAEEKEDDEGDDDDVAVRDDDDDEYDELDVEVLNQIRFQPVVGGGIRGRPAGRGGDEARGRVQRLREQRRMQQQQQQEHGQAPPQQRPQQPHQRGHERPQPVGQIEFRGNDGGVAPPAMIADVDPFQALREQRERERKAELDSWRAKMSVDGSGVRRGKGAVADPLSATKPQQLTEDFTDEERRVMDAVAQAPSPLIVIEEFARELGKPVPACVQLIESAIGKCKLQGRPPFVVLDERGKMLRVSEKALDAIADFIVQRGRVKQSELKEFCAANMD